jgi:hypothetical protein
MGICGAHESPRNNIHTESCFIVGVAFQQLNSATARGSRVLV